MGQTKQENKKELTMSLSTFLELMLLMFIGLKISGLIDWSWWWVFAPVWIPCGIVLILLGVMGFYLIITKAIGRTNNENKK